VNLQHAHSLKLQMVQNIRYLSLLAGESFGGLLERAFAARFGGASDAPGHPLAAANRSEAVVPLPDAPPSDSAVATANGGHQPVRPDVPEPGNAALAPAAAPEPGAPHDPDAPAAGPIPSGGPMAPATDLQVSTAFADPAAQLEAEVLAVTGGGGAADGGAAGGDAAAANGPVIAVQHSEFGGSGDAAVLVQPDGPDGLPDPTQPAVRQVRKLENLLSLTVTV